jgi:hypothetical protein
LIDSAGGFLYCLNPYSTGVGSFWVGYSFAGTAISDGSPDLLEIASPPEEAGGVTVASEACAAPASAVGPVAETVTSSSPEEAVCCEAVPAPFASGEFSIALLGLSPEAVGVEGLAEVVLPPDDAAVVPEFAAAAGDGDGVAVAAVPACAAFGDGDGCSVSAFFAAAGSSLDRYCEKI